MDSGTSHWAKLGVLVSLGNLRPGEIHGLACFKSIGSLNHWLHSLDDVAYGSAVSCDTANLGANGLFLILQGHRLAMVEALNAALGVSCVFYTHPNESRKEGCCEACWERLTDALANHLVGGVHLDPCLLILVALAGVGKIPLLGFLTVAISKPEKRQNQQSQHTS